MISWQSLLSLHSKVEVSSALNAFTIEFGMGSSRAR